MELDRNNNVVRKCTWGLDLAGQMGSAGILPAGLEGAGGIGGLLAMEAPQTVGDPLNYVYLYDDNGNVGQVIDLFAANAPAAIKAHYEYDPYGKRTNAAAPGEYDQPWRFSTKQFDAETGLYYFGRRYYGPQWGRWTNQDPIGEAAELNLYAYVGNRPTNTVDPLGMYWLLNPGANQKQQQACCKYTELTVYNPAIELLGSATERRRFQETVDCAAGVAAPEGCCRCSCFRSSFTSDFSRSLDSARWGKCCTCTVETWQHLKSAIGLPWKGFPWNIGSHEKLVMRCDDGYGIDADLQGHSKKDRASVDEHAPRFDPTQWEVRRRITVDCDCARRVAQELLTEEDRQRVYIEVVWDCGQYAKDAYERFDDRCYHGR
jgi:RHS repeat-associated protein